MDYLGTKFFEKELIFPLERNEILYGGSLPECQIYLPFKGISKTHFSLKFEGERWKIEDLNSKNGIYLNDKKIKEGYLNYGDLITLSFLKLKIFSKKINEIYKIELPDFTKENIFIKEGKKTDKVEEIRKEEDLYFLPNLKFPEEIVLGRSPEMYEAYRRLALTVGNASPVLLVGETGVGKEIFAKTIHLSSLYKNAGFVPINCAAIPKELFEAELFGTVKGAATDVKERFGKIPLANGGTLFLDEIDSMPLDLQVKLLRVIEDKEVYPLGKDRPIKVEFKLITASQKDPEILIKNGFLRGDLYHRISECIIKIPSLREREEDLELFINFFINKLCKNSKKKIFGVTKDFIEMLKNYNYIGNIRELRNIISEAILRCHSGVLLDVDCLPEKIKENNFERGEEFENDFNYHRYIEEKQREIIEKALKINNGNITKAANFLKISRRGLHKIIKRLKIKI